jgi:hypothetical protein
MKNLMKLQQRDSNPVTSRLMSTAKETTANKDSRLSSIDNFLENGMVGKNKMMTFSESSQRQNLA